MKDFPEKAKSTHVLALTQIIFKSQTCYAKCQISEIGLRKNQAGNPDVGNLPAPLQIRHYEILPKGFSSSSSLKISAMINPLCPKHTFAIL